MTTGSELRQIRISFIRICLLLRSLATLSPRAKREVENHLVREVCGDRDILQNEVDYLIKEFLHKVLASADILNQHTFRDPQQLERLLAFVKETLDEQSTDPNL